MSSTHSAAWAAVGRSAGAWPSGAAPSPAAALARQLDPSAGPMRVLVERMAGQAGDDTTRDVRERLTRCACFLAADQVRIVFGGHFSSGKSSLINMLIGRPVLPVSEYPETGVPCVISSAESDQIQAQTEQGAVRLAFTTESIARCVSLIGDDGDYREAPRAVNKLSITLASGPLAPQVSWIDSPGIDDTAEMTERAAVAAEDGDVLVWVVDSRHPVSEVEQEFLRGRITTHGPASVVFVVNAFLTSDTPEAWQSFLAEHVSYLRQRIATAVDIGTVAQEVVFVSARAGATHPDSFGSPETRAMLDSLGYVGQPRVIAARAYRAERELRTLVADLAERARAERKRVAAAQQAATQQACAIEKQRADFVKAVGPEVASVFARYRRSAEECVTEVAAMAGSALRYDNYYGDALTAKLRVVAGHVAGETVAAVNQCAGRYGQTSLRDNDVFWLGQLVQPPPITITVVKNAVSLGGMGAGAVAGAVIGGVVPVVGHVVGAGIGALVGRSSSKKMQVNKDMSAARASAHMAGAAAVEQLFGCRDKLLAVVQNACKPARVPAGEPDKACLNSLLAAGDHLEKHALTPLADIVAQQQGGVAA